jgi:glucan phosphoethanolaminetransferase (alkaline phosphatase superfamily)
MIQRIQTIYLSLAIVLLAITNLMPLASFQLPNGEVVEMSVISGDHTNITLLILISSIASALLCGISIFLYKNRKRQILIAYLALLPLLLLSGYFVGYSYGSASSAAHLSLVSAKGILLPIIALLFILLAVRKIKADEKLVRSLDRIR